MVGLGPLWSGYLYSWLGGQSFGVSEATSGREMGTLCAGTDNHQTFLWEADHINKQRPM